MRKLKLTLVVAMLAMVTAASAQLNLGVKGGLNMSNFSGKEMTDKNMKLGFHVGLAADYEFMPNFAVQSGLFFTTKGSEIKIGEAKYTENLMYLQVPVHLAYKLDVVSGTRITFHAGPYVAYGIGGKRSQKAGKMEASLDSKVFGKGLDQYKPLDAGLGLGVDTEFGPITVGLGWDMGLINISNVKGGNIKNQNAYLSVGYKFY